MSMSYFLEILEIICVRDVFIENGICFETLLIFFPGWIMNQLFFNDDAMEGYGLVSKSIFFTKHLCNNFIFVY